MRKKCRTKKKIIKKKENEWCAMSARALWLSLFLVWISLQYDRSQIIATLLVMCSMSTITIWPLKKKKKKQQQQNIRTLFKQSEHSKYKYIFHKSNEPFAMWILIDKKIWNCRCTKWNLKLYYYIQYLSDPIKLMQKKQKTQFTF